MRIPVLRPFLHVNRSAMKQTPDSNPGNGGDNTVKDGSAPLSSRTRESVSACSELDLSALAKGFYESLENIGKNGAKYRRIWLVRHFPLAKTQEIFKCVRRFENGFEKKFERHTNVRLGILKITAYYLAVILRLKKRSGNGLSRPIGLWNRIERSRFAGNVFLPFFRSVRSCLGGFQIFQPFDVAEIDFFFYPADFPKQRTSANFREFRLNASVFKKYVFP